MVLKRGCFEFLKVGVIKIWFLKVSTHSGLCRSIAGWGRWGVIVQHLSLPLTRYFWVQLVQLQFEELLLSGSSGDSK
jgi:hypothetical protein